jgi:hypothetical protein
MGHDQKARKTQKVKTLLYVEWADATTQDGWDSDHSLESHIIKSVGFLIKETSRDLVIAADWSEPESNRRLAIPKAWIQNKKELTL